MKNIDELEREIEAVFATQPTAHWVEKLDAAGVPGGPVYTYDQILADPHIKARKMVVEIDHPKIGRMKSLGIPVKSTGELLAIRKPAPWLGPAHRRSAEGSGLRRARHRRRCTRRACSTTSTGKTSRCKPATDNVTAQ